MRSSCVIEDRNVNISWTGLPETDQNYWLKDEKSNKYEVCMLFCVQIMHSRTEQCLFNLLEGALDFIHNILSGYTSNSDWTQIVRLTFPEDLTPFIKQKKMKIQANSKQIRFRILTSPMSYSPSGVSCSWSTCRLWTQIEMTECSCILVPIQSNINTYSCISIQVF